MDDLLQIPCPLLVTDLQGNILAANGDLLQVVGGTTDQWKQQNLNVLLTVPSRIFLQTHVWPMLLKTGNVRELYLHLRDSSGQPVPVMLNGSNGRYHDSDCIHWVFFVAKERSRFESDLVQAREKAQHMANDLTLTHAFLDRVGRIAGVGAWRLDLATMRPEWTDQTCRIHEVPPGYQPTLEAAVEFYAPESRPVIQALVQKCIAEGTSWDAELRVITATGRPVWVRTAGEVLVAAGKPVALVGAFQDITERKNIELALLQTNERFELAADSAGIGVWDFDVALRKMHWDKWMYHLYGRTVGDAIDPLVILDQSVHPEDIEQFRAALKAALADDFVFETGFRILWPNGELRHIKIVGRVRRDESGRAVRLIGVNFDVTAQKEYESGLTQAKLEADRATAAKGQFLANMSHEIRTPMNAILGMLGLLQKTPLTTRQRDYADKTKGAAHSLLGLLNDILDFSKMDAGKMTLDIQPFRLDQLMRGLSVIFSAYVGSKGVEVLFDIGPDIPAVLLGDSLRLQQVLVNLGGNAVKFTAAGHVLVQVRVKDRHDHEVVVEFAVKDSGIGISPENQGHIFSGFSQAESSTTRRFGGTGLGLSISQRLVELMGGELLLESELGAGSRFHFSVPLAIAQQVPVALQAGSRPVFGSIKVLIVDDHPVAGELLLQMARSLGWDATLLSSGSQAVRMLRAVAVGDAAPFDLLFLDWQMPDMDGWETLRQIGNIAPDLGNKRPLIVMVTANGQETLSLRTRKEQAQINGFLVKPVTASMVFDAFVDARAAGAGVATVDELASSQRRLDGMRLLVVEDNMVNQQIAEELLVYEGALVSLAANGQLGVEAIEAAHPAFDAVLMDVQMPVMDGYTATRFIRTTLGMTNLPVVAVTANAMPSDRAACLDAGMTDFVGKPFDLDTLVATLRRCVGWVEFVERPASQSPPQARLPTKAATAKAHYGQLDGEVALSRMGGSTGLYLKALKSFLKECDGSERQLQHYLSSGDNVEAVRLMHTLKGLAATVGAAAFASFAGEAEVALMSAPERDDGQLVSRLQTAVGLLSPDLVAAIEMLEAGLAKADTKRDPGASAASGMVALPKGLEQLRALLLRSDMGALELHARLRLEYEPEMGDAFDELNSAVNSLAFERAAECCEVLMSQSQG
jgi:signal transduction histidine kinase/CheY-like chemotaxis protein